jgi:hypothetical protein
MILLRLLLRFLRLLVDIAGNSMPPVTAPKMTYSRTDWQSYGVGPTYLRPSAFGDMGVEHCWLSIGFDLVLEIAMPSSFYVDWKGSHRARAHKSEATGPHILDFTQSFEDRNSTLSGSARWGEGRIDIDQSQKAERESITESHLRAS